jgi:hypothetical protein
MSETQKQAIQRFVGFLIAEVLTLVVGLLSSDQIRALITDLAGEGSLIATLMLAILPPLIGAIGKLMSGPTEKVSTAKGRGVDSTVNEGPGLFG